jgi:RNase P subunit RPR2
MQTPKETELIYCVKCRNLVGVKNTKVIMMKSDRPAFSGECPKCNIKVYKIIAKEG